VADGKYFPILGYGILERLHVYLGIGESTSTLLKELKPLLIFQVLFVIDGVWAWGPVGWDVTWAPEKKYASGIFFFVGALMYQVGAVMAYLEAVNNGSFSGHAMKRFIDGHDEDQKAMLDAHLHGFLHHANPLHHHHHHHSQKEDEEKQTATVDPTEGWKTLNQRDRERSVYAMRKPNVPRRGGVDLGEDQDGVYEYTSWRWWPKWETLKSHHVQEIGYIACSIQLFGATLYSWCGLVSIPGISSKWTANATWYGGYWLPEVFGSCCFLSASFMFLSQAQHKWWKPEAGFIGWWIGFWAMIGSWGFREYIQAERKKSVVDHFRCSSERYIWRSCTSSAGTRMGGMGE
jgi:hypothetical protein